MDLLSLLSEYSTLPEYSGLHLTDVNQMSLFGDRPIHVAAVRGAIAELKLLVDNGADLNCKGEHGYTPLHDAVEQGRLDAVKWLLENGADPTIRNNFDQTALDLARLLDLRDIELLLNNNEIDGKSMGSD